MYFHYIMQRGQSVKQETTANQYAPEMGGVRFRFGDSDDVVLSWFAPDQAANMAEQLRSAANAIDKMYDIADAKAVEAVEAGLNPADVKAVQHGG